MPRLTLNRVFAISLAGLLAALALLYVLVFRGLESATLQSASQAREENSKVIGQSVEDYLSQAPDAVESFQALLRIGLVHADNADSLRDALLTTLLRNDDISEATFTFAKITGSAADGTPTLDPQSVGQVSLFRALTGSGYVHRHTWYQAGDYISTHTHIALNGRETQIEPPAKAPSPGEHATFTSPILPVNRGQPLWSDLQWFEPDLASPTHRRRVEVSVQEAIDEPPGHFAGVLRIGLFKDKIDRAIEMPPVDTRTHTIFLCDNDARLIAMSGTTHYRLYGDDLRVDPKDAPPQILEALQRPILHRVDADHASASGNFVLSGTNFLYTFRSLPQTQDWVVGVVVPERAYLGDLLNVRRYVARRSALLVIIIAVFGTVVLHGVSRAHSIIVREAGRMNDFRLEPSANFSRLSDINRVLASLERAKTAMRSMGKYVPLDLVRKLYHRGEEPRLGGEATELSVLFSDIQGFTTFAEGTDADIVATYLGAYMQAMVSTIQNGKGTIDKFIGDSVMAFWNAPEPVPGHAAHACRTALACRAALAELYKSPQWEGMPGFETRFGLHECVASVGHFGAPDRFNYTAIGDGVNLASRLESLNKYYGSHIIVSAAIRDTAGPGFVFRWLDRVAVKGKTESLDIYELICDGPAPAWVAVYEQALKAWMAGDFAAALALAESQPDDPPSVFLAARCLEYLKDPPVGWTGVYMFETK
jgi:adenylate cyclase